MAAISRIKRLIVETHQRSLWQAVVVYLGASLGVLGGVDLLIEYLGLPRWFIWAAFSLLVVGLPVVVVISLAKEEVYGEEVPAEHAAAAAAEDRRLQVLTWRTAGLAFVGALAMWGVMLTTWIVVSPRARLGVGEAFADAPPGIAVLPFSIRGDGLDHLHEGMVDLLSVNLDGVEGLRAIDSRNVLARWRELAPSTGERDQSTMLEIARASGARYALLGSAVALGGEIRFMAQIYESETGKDMGSVQATGSPDSLPILVDRLAVQSLIAVLGQEASELPPVDLAGVTTASIPALMEWLEAEALYRRGDHGRAIAAYERAVDLDSTFALAYYGLGHAYGWHGGPMDEAFAQALRFVDRLPAREAAVVRATNAWPGDNREAEEILLRLVRTYPDYALAWFVMGDFYYHAGTAIPVSVDSALRCFRQAAELDPQNASYRVHIVELAFRIDPDSAHVDSLIEDYTRLIGGAPLFGEELAFDLAFGDEERRQRALASVDTGGPGLVFAAVTLTHPRFWPQQEAALLALERRVQQRRGSVPAWTTRVLFLGAVGRGHLRKALGYLDRPQAASFVRGCLPVDAYVHGYPVPADRLNETAAVLSQVDSTSEAELVHCAGLLAAAQGRWADHARAVELSWDAWRREVDAGRSGGDAQANALAVEAYGLWRRGDPQAALEKLDEVRHYQATIWVRTVVGYVLMDLERWEEAVPYLRTWWWAADSHMNYHLGRAYEQTGEYGKAANEYAFFVEAWADADPELQPWVEDALRALERLAPDR